MGYIRIPKVYEKLKKAEELYTPVIMTAASGFGKSAAVEYFYRRKKPLILRCRNGSFSEMPDPDSFRGSVIIVEDMQWLSEENGIRYLFRLLECPGRQIVMLTRGNVPNYLLAESLQQGFVQIREPDFVFGVAEVDAFFRDRGITLPPEDAEAVRKASEGYVTALHFYALHMENGEHFSKQIREQVWQDLLHLWDRTVYPQWPEEFRTFVLAVCPYESFTISMAELLTGSENIAALIEYCREKTGQLLYVSEGEFSLRPEVHRFFIWKRALVYSKGKDRENYQRAAEYYETQGETSKALMYYKKAGAEEHMKEILIRTAARQPGNGQFVEIKDYYLQREEEEILGSPVLIAAMSLLYDLLLQPEKSEEWYQKLLDFSRDEKNSVKQRGEAQVRLAYLDIGLPHRGTKGLDGIIAKIRPVVQKRKAAMPELSVTGNMPSLLNGVLDFCTWTKDEGLFARLLEEPMKSVLGGYTKGLLTLAYAESGFEKGSMPAGEVLTRCIDGYEAAAFGGKIEMCFAAAAVQVRLHIAEGHLLSAKRTYDLFAEKAKAEKAVNLFPNLRAFGVWMSLYGGSSDEAEQYIEEVTNVRLAFSTNDRYRQSVKLRCLIAENRLEEAFDLATFLAGYLNVYERYAMGLENGLMQALILYRMGKDGWQELLLAVIRKAEEYHFVRAVTMEGTAVLPMLKLLKETGSLEEAEEEFCTQLITECVKMATSYPDYMRFLPKENISLTGRERQVLSMLCAGMSMEEICEEMGITYDGLKKHNRNIYKKLGAKGRAEAERKAVRLGLVHHSLGGNSIS